MPTTNDLFVDTAGWVCLLNDQDPHYSAFAAFVQRVPQWQRLVTTNYVIAELVALFSQSRLHLSRQRLIKAINSIKINPNVEIVHIEQASDNEAWALLEARLDKGWSLVDASSFVVMKRFDITHALTTDHHFTQAGFFRVPEL